MSPPSQQGAGPPAVGAPLLVVSGQPSVEAFGQQDPSLTKTLNDEHTDASGTTEIKSLSLDSAPPPSTSFAFSTGLQTSGTSAEALGQKVKLKMISHS